MDTPEPQQKIEQLKKDIAILSSQLSTLNLQKEEKYKEKNSTDIELNSLIKSAQELRDKKKLVDEKIKALKKIRDSGNSELKKLFDKRAEKKSGLGGGKKDRPKQNPAAIRKQIELMSFAIETEGLSFEREQSYMEKIKHLKSQLVEIEAEDEKFAELRQIRSEIVAKKTSADEAHAEVQKLASESSGIFSELKTKSEQIEKAKKSRAALNATLKDMKAHLEGANTQLASVLSEWSEVTKAAAPAAAIPSIAQSDVMGQLKAKKKLTKDDILAMQKAVIRKRWLV